MAYVTLPTVVDDEYITTAWGNQVRENFVVHNGLIARLLDSTGYTSVTVASGFTGSIIMRRDGAIVWLNVQVVKTAAATAASHSIGTVPAGSRPAFTNSRGILKVSAPDLATSAQVESDGTIRLPVLTVSAGGSITGSIVYNIALP